MSEKKKATSDKEKIQEERRKKPSTGNQAARRRKEAQAKAKGQPMKSTSRGKPRPKQSSTTQSSDPISPPAIVENSDTESATDTSEPEKTTEVPEENQPAPEKHLDGHDVEDHSLEGRIDEAQEESDPNRQNDGAEVVELETADERLGELHPAGEDGTTGISNTSDTSERAETAEPDAFDQMLEDIDQEPTATLRPSDRLDVLTLYHEVSKPKVSFFRSLSERLNRSHYKMEIRKYLLPGEKHLSAKLLVYFDEVQIILGTLISIVGLISHIFTSNFILTILIFLLGILTIITGYSTEEIHVTTNRIMIRRMNWVDRVFKIPRDSQYILAEIVSFDIKRAPMNVALFVGSILPLLFLFFPLLREPIPLIIIISISFFLMILSQRLNKRSLQFSMSGGHIVFLGAEKGLPFRMIQEFTNIVMKFNVFMRDGY